MKYLRQFLLGLTLAIAIGGCGTPIVIPPGPGPVPPGPTPVVKVDSVWVETIDDFGKRTGELRKLMTDLPYWASLQKRGHHYRFLDVTADADDVNKKLQIFLNVKPPCVILYNAADNSALGAAPLKDKAGVDGIVEKFSSK